MSGDVEINRLVIDSIANNCSDDVTKGLIESLIRYELDIFNRKVPDKQIKDHYHAFIDFAIKEMKD